MSLLSADGSVVSSETGGNGQPLLVAKKADNKSIHISVMALKQCSLVLQAAKEKRLSETRSCLEGMQTNTCETWNDSYINIFVCK